MLSRFILCLGILCLGWTSTPAPAASFDCARASATLEKTICADKALNDADTKLGSVYRQLLKALPEGDAGRLRQDQRAWLKTRTSFCRDTDATCILPVYQARISVLEARLKAAPGQQASAGNSRQGSKGAASSAQTASKSAQQDTPKRRTRTTGQTAQTTNQTQTTTTTQPQAATTANPGDALTQALAQALTQALLGTLSPEAPPPSSGASASSSSPEPSSYYRLSTLWQGEGTSLTLAEGDLRAYLDVSSEDPSQFWKVIPEGDGSYWLTTYWLGDDYVLDIYIDENNMARPYMVEVGQGGETWWFTPVGDGYYRVTTSYLGSNYSLDIVNDGINNNQLVMAPSGNYSGQYWTLTPATVQTAAAPAAPTLQESYPGDTISEDALMVMMALREAAASYDYDTLSAYAFAGYFENELGPWIDQDPRVLDVMIETLDTVLAGDPAQYCGYLDVNALVCSNWSQLFGQTYSLSLIDTDEFGWMLEAFWAGAVE